MRERGDTTAASRSRQSPADAAVALGCLPAGATPRVLYAGDLGNGELFVAFEVLDPATGELIDLGLVVEHALVRRPPVGGPAREPPRDPPEPAS